MKIDITLSPKNPKSAHPNPKSKRRRGVLPIEATDFVPRRRREKGLIRFFDIGQRVVGSSYADRVFTIVTNMQPGSGGAAVARFPAASDFAPVLTEVLAIENLSAATRPVLPDYYPFYQLSIKGDGFEYQLDASEERFSDAGGLALTAEELDSSDLVLQVSFGAGAILTTDYVYFRSTFTNQPNKFTLEPSYEASEAMFRLKRQAKIFLMPVFLHSRSFADLIRIPTGLPPKNFVLNSIYRTLPRSVWLSQNPVPTAQNVRNYYERSIYNDVGDYEQAYQTALIHRSFSGARAFAGNGGVISPMDLTNYPPPPYYTPTTRGNDGAGYYGNDLINEFQSFVTPTGFLVAIIEQAAKRYYVWRN
jgi:hypothetical protein